MLYPLLNPCPYCAALKNKEGTSLFRHELAYVLGQMQDAAAKPTLEAVLRDTTDAPIVRHECAEALGALGDPESLDLLREFASDSVREVSETCEIALARIRWANSDGVTAEAEAAAATDKNPYDSVDPAPAVGGAPKSVPELRTQLLDASLPLFDRYRALFSLRNLGSEDAVLAIADVLTDASALFRHEAAYVLGQMAHPAATTALRDVVENKSEMGMVRHEAAEALGAIGSEEATDFLKKHLGDDSEVVRESCEVALDIADYWSDPKAGEALASGADGGAGGAVTA